MNRRINKPILALSSLLRSLAAVAGLAVCLLSLWMSARGGISRLFSLHGRVTAQLASADEAVQLSPADPEARYARTTALLSAGQTKAALAELEQAVALRPRYYGLWLELGRTRDLAGDSEGALAAFKQAAELAPNYAQPRWQLGNLLLRLGRVDEAFAELGRAAASDPALLPNAADLAWGAFDGDARAVEQIIQPQTDSARMELAVLLAKRGKAEEAMRLFRVARQVPAAVRRRLLTELLSANRFHESFEVWSAGRGASPRDTTLVDGSFEQGFILDELSFGWLRTRDTQTVRLGRDPQQPYAGRASLRVDWNGNSEPATSLLLQLVVVEPRHSYRLSFAARTQEIVAGGLPEVLVIDAESNGRALVQAVPLPLSNNGWRNYATEFTTGNATRAVRLIVRRQDCAAAGPCPAFGTLWLDDFALAEKR
jgi:tetratricopeptide (TPR) repeat protein